MKFLLSIITLTLIVSSASSQTNIKDLLAYQDVQVITESQFNPSVALVLDDKEYDKLLVGEKFSAFLEMNDFKIVSKEAGKALDKAYLFQFNYEYEHDKKKCGGSVIKFLNGKVIDMNREDVVANFKFEQKGNKICTEDIAKVLAYKLKRGS